MFILTVATAYFLLTALIIIFVCVLSSRVSREEKWEETPIIESHSERNVAPDYQTDAAAS